MPGLVNRLTLLAAAAAAAARALAQVSRDHSQQPLGHGGTSADFLCPLPPILNPAGDGLPAAADLFSSADALARQVERHQAIVRVPSVCFDDLRDVDDDERWAPFYRLHHVLAKTYPVIHERATLDKINRFGLLYTIEGSDSSLKPTMLTAHQDVVPVGDESMWTHPPFDAVYDGTLIWGRGASDDKNSITALMSAVEALLSDRSWQPTRTIVLAFGFDEECAGNRGAASIGKVLSETYGDDGVAVILDEGGLGVLTMPGGVTYALPAVMEKGRVDIWFELRVRGGHSSIPLPHTGIGIVSEIVTILEANPYEMLLTKDSPVYNYMVCEARYSSEDIPGLADMIEKDDLEGLADMLAATHPAARFLIQTSQAVDFMAGGQKINALPEVITLGVNYRVAPQDSLVEVQHNVVKYISGVVQKYDLSLEAFADDESYQTYIASLPGQDAAESEEDVDYEGTLVLTSKDKTEVAPKSPTSGAVWDVFSGTIQHSFAGEENSTVVPVGQIMTGNTDTRHYLNLSPNIYRWTPYRYRGNENAHAINERMDMNAHMEMVRFYYDFVRNFDAADC